MKWKFYIESWWNKSLIAWIFLGFLTLPYCKGVVFLNCFIGFKKDEK